FLACQIQAIGLASSDAIPDNSFSASTHRSGNEASKGRLNGNGAWSPSGNSDDNDYLQIDLKDQFFICAVATQGSSANHWTKKYKLRYSVDNSTWLTYQENDTDKIFNANDGEDDIVKHSLVGIVRARFIHFHPTEFEAEKALRVEVYGILTTTAPGRAPTSFMVTPTSSTSVQASWQLPTVDFQAITGFRLLYRNLSSVEDPLTVITIEGYSTLSHEVTGLGIFTKYEFQVLAFSIMGDGPSSAVKTVRTNAEAPSFGPDTVFTTELNETTFNISWAPLPTEKSNGIVVRYEANAELVPTRGRSRRAVASSKGVSTTETFAVFYDFLTCSQYSISVRAFTAVGPGPYGTATLLQTSSR
ncbi:unnamed protein product, partial [Porites lobata]